MHNFIFVIRDTESNSKVFGDCEICRKFTAQVFCQTRYKEKINPVTNKKFNMFVTSGYGHRECLIRNRLIKWEEKN